MEEAEKREAKIELRRVISARTLEYISLTLLKLFNNIFSFDVSVKGKGKTPYDDKKCTRRQRKD